MNTAGTKETAEYLAKKQAEGWKGSVGIHPDPRSRQRKRVPFQEAEAKRNARRDRDRAFRRNGSQKGA